MFLLFKKEINQTKKDKKKQGIKQEMVSKDAGQSI